MNSRRVWTQQQDKVIVQLVQEYGTKNWASIAIHLSKKLREKARSGKQCRQRWHNHLNPGIEKKDWSKNEEEKMFQLHKIHGNKWTIIAEQLPGRTDNAIKNYFYSTIRRSLRRMGKFVGSKNSTQQMKKIKPSTLSKIFAAQSQLIISQDLKEEQIKLITYIKQNSQSVRDEIIQFTNYKPKRNDKAPQHNKDRFQSAISKMIHINNVYQKIKGEEKKRRYQQLMFQKDYNKLMLSSDSQEQSEDSQSHKIPIKPISYRMNYQKINKQSHIQDQDQQIELTNVKNDQNNINIMPTVIIKSQFNLEQQHQQQVQFDNPDFLIQLKEDFIPQGPNQFSSSMRSPGYYFNTPTINPFCFFQSPLTPKNIDCTFSNIQGLGVLQNSAIDEFQISIQKQIESNMNGENSNNINGQEKKLNSSISTIGSPGSAFRFCGGFPLI